MLGPASRQLAVAGIARAQEKRAQQDALILSQPTPVRAEAVKRVVAWVSERLGIKTPEIVYYAPRPLDDRLGFVMKHDGSRIYIASHDHETATDRNATDLCRTAIHECVHHWGSPLEETCNDAAVMLLKAYERETLAPQRQDLDNELPGISGFYRPRGGF
jgi:hypothetical protein